jgi:hypothetical protein
VELFRVVAPAEAEYLSKHGNYGASPSQAGKYFALTPAGAFAFSTDPINKDSVITATSVPKSVYDIGFKMNDPGKTGAGPSVFYEDSQLPIVYSTMTPPVLVPVTK